MGSPCCSESHNSINSDVIFEAEPSAGPTQSQRQCYRRSRGWKASSLLAFVILWSSSAGSFLLVLCQFCRRQTTIKNDRQCGSLLPRPCTFAFI